MVVTAEQEESVSKLSAGLSLPWTVLAYTHYTTSWRSVILSCKHSKHTLKLDALNPMGSEGATRLEDVESGLPQPIIYHIIPVRFDGSELPLRHC